MIIHETDSSRYIDFSSKIIAEKLEKALNHKDYVTVALSGGKTPLPIYKKLASIDLNWSRVVFFLVDERIVPLNNPESNYKVINEVFFKHINAKKFSVIDNSLNVRKALKKYRSLIEKYVKKKNNYPSFDFMILGMGKDGHTASLFPNTKALNEKNEIITDNFVPILNSKRITLTLPVIINSEEIFVLIRGKEKKEIFDKLYTAKGAQYPMQHIINQRKDVNWIIEK